MPIYVRHVLGDNYGQVDDEDCERAIAAAEAVCAKAGVEPAKACAEYRKHLLEYDDEESMTGAARVWLDASSAADVR